MDFPVTSHPPSPSKTTRALIGDIIMRSAEIDELVSMALFKISMTPPANGFILLDRLAIGTKLKRLQYFVELLPDVWKIEAYEQLEKDLSGFLRIRNTLAHGVYIGKDADGSCNFSVSSDYVAVGTEYVHRVTTLSDESLRLTLAMGDHIATSLRTLFSVQTLGEEAPELYVPERPKTPRSLRKSKSG